MRYTLTTPCDQCPYLRNSGFPYASLVRHATGEFPCHKACELVDTENDGSVFMPRNEKTPHCAGALIFLEKQGRPHQMMRICERLGMYDASKLDMAADVGSTPSDYRRRRPRRPKMTERP